MKAAALAALLACPAGPGSRTPHLAAAPDALYLSWQEPGAGGATAVKVARFDGRSWSRPRSVVESKDLFVNWADFPALAAWEGGGVAVSWLPKSATGTYTYDVVVATSGDGGRSWGAPASPHRDGTQSEHGFVTLLPGRGGRFTAVWLDGRDKDWRAPKKGAQKLYAADWNGSGFDPEVELDGRVCDCCGTDAVSVGGKTLVAYRDRSGAEVRDMSLVSRDGGRWSLPRPLAEDGWTIKGCPVNGPALAAKGDRAAALWFTAGSTGEQPQVKAAFSSDGGESFGPATRVDSGSPAGRVDLVMLEDGSVAAVWVEGGAKPALLARRVLPDGSASAPFEVAATTSTRAAGHPRLARWGRRVVAAWTDVSQPQPRVRLSAFDPLLPRR